MAKCQKPVNADFGSACYTFYADWRDVENCVVTEFKLSYFLSDGCIELFDLKKCRVFLKKCRCPNVSLSDLYVGNSVNIMSRQINILDYGDKFTRQHMQVSMQQTFILLKPDLLVKLGTLMDEIQQHGFTIGRLRTAQLTNDQAVEVNYALKGSTEMSIHVQYLISGPIVCMELRGEDAVKRCIEIVGPHDPEEARKTSPSSLRAKFGRDPVRNGFLCARNNEEVEKYVNLFFETTEVNNTATYKDCTCCVIKPYAVQSGFAGRIVQDIIEAGFKITAVKLMILDIQATEEFLEIYRGLLPEYASMVVELSCGPCIAMEITGRGPETPTEFRDFVGPSDPDLARKLRPNTLRAKYGKEKTSNAIHCTDLPEDGQLEVEYFFKHL